MTATERRGLVMAIVLVGYLLILLDVSILMVALPRIHRELGFSATALSWAQNAYTLVFGGLLLVGPRAGDLLGRRRMFIAGIGLFAVAPAAVGLGPITHLDDRCARRAGYRRRDARPIDARAVVDELSRFPRVRSETRRWLPTARWPESGPAPG